MAREDNRHTDKELAKVRNALIRINRKARTYSQLRGKSFHSTDRRSTRSPKMPQEISLKQIRGRLAAINDYLRRRSQTELVSSDVPHVGPHARQELSRKLGVGLDVGTSYIVAARQIGNRRVFFKDERNAFLSVKWDKTTRELLEKLEIKYVTLGKKVYVLGHAAFDLANALNREAQRSMSRGVLNPSEVESIPAIKVLTQNILWTPREPGEICCFSIPAAPLDRDQDTIYHRGVFGDMLRDLGFEPIVIEEGYAVILSELGHKDFTGIGISCGGGLVNVCSAYQSFPLISFSISRGGDWIDKSAASALDMATSTVTAIKERGMHLKKPLTREQEAIGIYYRDLIRYLLESMAEVIGKSVKAPQFKKPIDIIFAGGLVMIGDFLEVAIEEMRSIDMGFPISAVKKADKPFTSVSRGCLLNAMNSGKPVREDGVIVRDDALTWSMHSTKGRNVLR